MEPGGAQSAAEPAPAKRARAGPSGLALLRRACELGGLGTRALVFAMWAEGHSHMAPQLVYYCDRPLPLSAQQLKQLASPHLLLGQALQLVRVTTLADYEAMQKQRRQPQADDVAPTLPEDVRRSFKLRLARLESDSVQCSDGPFVAYVMTAGHKTAAKDLLGGSRARAMFRSVDWATKFEEGLYVPNTLWPEDDYMRAEVEPGTFDWYAAFFDFGRGYIGRPTPDTWVLPDVVLEVLDTGKKVWRIKDAPVDLELVESAADLGALRATYSCRNFNDTVSVARGCLHTAYATCLVPPPPVGPKPPPMHVPAARGARVKCDTLLRGDYFWVAPRTFVACAVRTGQVRCSRSGCGASCQHIQEVLKEFGPRLPPAICSTYAVCRPGGGVQNPSQTRTR